MAAPGLRIDKWLWFARFMKSRTLAAELYRSGRLRVNRQAVEKPHHRVRPGDMLTFALNDRVRVIEVLALAERRGPSPEARALYTDRTPPAPELAPIPPTAERDRGAGRPTKRDRRLIDRFANTED
jgi:ribosome-associated heat shock protein Hsp15